MALDWCQNFVSIQYLENKLVDFDEILCMQYCDTWNFPQTFQQSYGPWLMLKFQFFSVSLEIMNGLSVSWVLDLRDLSLEGVELLCQADMTWKLVPLYYGPGKEREACIVCLFSIGCIDVLFFQCRFSNRGLHQWQQSDFISYRAWRVWNPLTSVQGIASPDCAACLIHLMYYDIFLSPTLLPSSEPYPVDLLACGLFCHHLWD